MIHIEKGWYWTARLVFEFTAPSSPDRHRQILAIFNSTTISDPSIARIPNSDIGRHLYEAIVRFLDGLSVPRGLKAVGSVSLIPKSWARFDVWLNIHFLGIREVMLKNWWRVRFRKGGCWIWFLHLVMRLWLWREESIWQRSLRIHWSTEVSSGLGFVSFRKVETLMGVAIAVNELRAVAMKWDLLTFNMYF